MQYTTPHTLDFLKRKARILAKKSGIQHSKALDKVVQDEGFENWRHYLNSTKQSSTHPAVSTEANIQSLINTPIPYPYIKTTPTEASTLLEAAKKVIPNLTHFGIGIHAEAKARKESAQRPRQDSQPLAP